MYSLMEREEICLTTNSDNRDFFKNMKGGRKSSTESDKTPTPTLITENKGEHVTFVSKF